ncbi:MAG TPA: hypothetical protein VN649_04715 [Ramlibacter sp.]|nr:hypothetical protein [Ramlibacter sp.]
MSAERRPTTLHCNDDLLVVLAAARLGATRLIDNVELDTALP